MLVEQNDFVQGVPRETQKCRVRSRSQCRKLEPLETMDSSSVHAQHLYFVMSSKCKFKCVCVYVCVLWWDYLLGNIKSCRVGRELSLEGSNHSQFISTFQTQLWLGIESGPAIWTGTAIGPTNCARAEGELPRLPPATDLLSHFLTYFISWTSLYIGPALLN